MQLIKQTQPRNVVLVHGEKQKMAFLKKRIQSEFIYCVKSRLCVSYLMKAGKRC
jgi:predicted metal-dependent RNase